MNFMITIAKEVVGIGGYTTIEKIETISRGKALKKIENMTIVRRYPNPFNSSIEIVVVE